MPAPSFSSFPSLPTPKPADKEREASPPKRQKRYHHYERDEEGDRYDSDAKRLRDGDRADRPRQAEENRADRRNGSERISRNHERRGERKSDRSDDHYRQPNKRKEGRARDRDDRSRRDYGSDREAENMREDRTSSSVDRRSENMTKGRRSTEEDRHKDRYITELRSTLPIRDEQAGFFADTMGTGRGTSQADWKGVARYWRETQNVLGLPIDVCIDRYKDESQPGLSLRWKREVDRASQKTRLPAPAPDNQIRRLASSNQPLEPSATFVPIARTRIMDNEDGSDDDFDTQFNSFPLAERQRQDEVMRMEEAVRADPHDTQTWLQYSTAHLRKQKHSAATAAITLAILDKALEFSGNEASSNLQLAYLSTAAEVWPGDQLAARWAATLRIFPMVRAGSIVDGSIEVWLAYLNWCEGSGLGLVERNEVRGYDAVVDVYHGVIREIRAVLLSGAGQQAEEILLYLLSRYALFVRHTGYGELGYALMQALMEITFFRPLHLRAASTPFSQLLGEFAVFWDSDVPRFGEDGAQGWCSAGSGTSQSTTDTKAITEITEWYETEMAADRAQNRSSRLSIDIESDPFRCVVFEDILPVLFPISSPDVRLQVIYSYLAFVGVGMVPPDSSTNAPYTADPYLQWSVGKRSDRMWPARIEALSLPWRETVKLPVPSFNCPVKSWVSETRTLMSTGDWFHDVTAQDLADLDIPLIRNSLELLRPLVPDPRFAMTCLAVEAAISVKSASAMSKRILKTDGENLLLWDAHARLERLKGKTATARIVYATALAAAVLRQARPDEDEIDLWQAWLEMEIGDGDPQAVLTLFALRDQERIVQYGSGAISFSQIERLRCKKFYDAMTEMSTHALYLRASYIARVQGSVQVACELFENSLSSGRADAVDESARQTYAQFLITLPVTPFARLLHHVKASIALYPNNTLLLSLLVHLKRQGRDIIDLVSRIEHAGDNTVVSGIWAAWAIGNIAGDAFWKNGSAERERVRVLLDRIVSDKRTSRSASAWVLYIRFEAAFTPSRAKALCYRALNHVGANKDLFMLPFSNSLLEQFSPRELNDWTQVMLDRGIRLRIAIPLSDSVLDPAFELPDDEDLLDEAQTF